MSWNAAKRALALGYAHVAWYPEGADGWAAAGLPLEKRTAGEDAELRGRRRQLLEGSIGTGRSCEDGPLKQPAKPLL